MFHAGLVLALLYSCLLALLNLCIALLCLCIAFVFVYTRVALFHVVALHLTNLSLAPLVCVCFPSPLLSARA